MGMKDRLMMVALAFAAVVAVAVAFWFEESKSPLSNPDVVRPCRLSITEATIVRFQIPQPAASTEEVEAMQKARAAWIAAHPDQVEMHVESKLLTVSGGWNETVLVMRKK